MVGTNIEVGGKSYSIVECRTFRGSPRSGVPDGLYDVVFDVDKNGTSTPKIVYEGKLYTVKNYGKGDSEVILKQREARAKSGTAGDEVTTTTGGDVPVEFGLEPDVIDLLASYKKLEHKADPEAWLNAQLRRLLTEEVGRLDKLRDGMKRIPSDVLSGLVTADPKKLAKVRELLGDAG